MLYFLGLVTGIINLRSSMLTEIHVPEVYFGIVFAVLQVGAAIASRYSEKIHKAFRNKTLTYLTLPVTVSCILVGFIGKDTLSKSSLILIVLLFLIQYAIKGPYRALMSRYINNFTNRKIRPKINSFKLFTFKFIYSRSIFNMFNSLRCNYNCKYLYNSRMYNNNFCSINIRLYERKSRIKPEQYSKEDLKI